MAASTLQQIVTASEPLRIIFSAGSYLAEFGTEIATLVEYYIYHDHLLRQNFYNLLVSLVLAHLATVVVFKMKLQPSEKPITSALFLPLIQLWKLVKALDFSPIFSFQRLEINILDDRSTLYSVLALTLKTSPALQIQHDAIYNKKMNSLDDKQRIPPVLIVSIVAALLSAGINGSIAVLSKATNANSSLKKTAVAILAGCYISSAILMRSISCSIFRITGVRYIPTLLILFSCYGLLNWLLYWLLISPGSLRSQLTLRKAGHAIPIAWISSSTCPLYVLVSDANEHKQLGTSQYRTKLLFMGMWQLLIEVIAWTILANRPRPKIADSMFFARLGVAQIVYLAATFGIIWLDYYCGPEENANTDDGIEKGQPHASVELVDPAKSKLEP